MSVSIGTGTKIWTGSAEDGTEAMNAAGTSSRALGNAGGHWVMQGSPNGSDSAHGPIESNTASRNTDRRLYGLSGVFTVDASLDADTTPPALESATVLADGATIDLVFDEPYNIAAAAGVTTTQFSVTADGSTVTVGLLGLVSELISQDSVFRTVQLKNLSPAITHGQVVTVSYIDPTTGDDTTAVIQDAAGNDAASFTTGSGGVPTVVNNVPNTAPAFLLESTTREVEENSPAGTDVGLPVTATDADDDTLTYTLEGTDAASFDIDSTSGQIQTKSGIAYDYETTPSYSVVVRADDGNGGTDTIAVAIDLLDVDETAPTPDTDAPTLVPTTWSWSPAGSATATASGCCSLGQATETPVPRTSPTTTPSFRIWPRPAMTTSRPTAQPSGCSAAPKTSMPGTTPARRARACPSTG